MRRTAKALLVGCTLLSGCMVHRVSVAAGTPARPPAKQEEVRVHPTFREVPAPWRLEGMLSAHLLPQLQNTTENREALAKEVAAGEGALAIVGVRELGLGVRLPLRSNAVLATLGTPLDDRALPRFLVCMPPTAAPAGLPETYGALLREQLPYTLAYTHGYYLYPCEDAQVTEEALLGGTADAEALARPLGVAPHFVLLTRIDGYDDEAPLSLGDRLFAECARSLRITLTLWDLGERREVWRASAEGSLKSKVCTSLHPKSAVAQHRDWTNQDQNLVLDAVLAAVATMPKVGGLRPGKPTHFDSR